jgi:hypothetical protein
MNARKRAHSEFKANYPAILKAFEVTVANSNRLGQLLAIGRDAEGHSHVSLFPLYLIFQRQTMLAFESLVAGQAYNAWVTIRPGIEAALIMGKWVASPANADIWEDRDKNPKLYQATYQGPALGKGALPQGELIRQALKGINDHFVHPNPSYSYRHLRFEEGNREDYRIHLNFFDSASDVELGLVGLLHLAIVTQDALAEMFAGLFQAPRLDMGRQDFEEKAASFVDTVSLRGPYFVWALRTIGLWDVTGQGDAPGQEPAQ